MASTRDATNEREIPKIPQKPTVRFSIETVRSVEQLPIHHCMQSYTHPAVDLSPDPVLSPLANPDVLFGKKSWPAVNPLVVESEPTICVICGVDFKTRSGLHTHLSDHKHLIGKVDKYKKVPLYECKLCAAELNCTTVLRHRCFVRHAAQISEVEALMDAVGSPLVCIFCRGRILPSRAHLIVHLISAHSPHRNPLKCVFCNCKFRSDNLLMQETHVFTHHVPELIFLNRLAYFKEIKTANGLTADAKVPFVCLYDSGRTEIPSWIDDIKEHPKDPWVLSNRSKLTDSSTKVAANDLCYKSFMNLAEFTAHIYCTHAILPHFRDKGKKLNSSEMRQLDEIKRDLPGPSIRELIQASTLGPFGKSKITQGNFSEKQNKGVDLARQSLILKGGWNKFTKLPKTACRICLHDYETEEELTRHINDFHLPETRKRVKHLANVEELVRTLDMDKLCTECFTMFTSVFKLQVHIIVAHGGKSWCNCGLCDQQFCESNQCLPAYLTISPALVATEDENQNRWDLVEEITSAATEPPSVERNPSFQEDLDTLYAPYESRLPTLTLCRILDCHEAKHYTSLQPSLKFPFLPTDLITQLLESRGHQGKQIFDWLSNAFDQPPMTDIKYFVYDDPNSKKMGKGKIVFRMNPGEDPLSQEGVEIGKRMLEGLMARRMGLMETANSDAEDEVVNVKESMVSEITHETNTLTASLHTSTRGGSTSTDVATGGTGVQKSSLPRKLVKFFTRLGERNAVVQQERDFMERV